MQSCSQVPSDGVSTSNPSDCTKGATDYVTSNNTYSVGYVHPAAIALRLRVTQVVCGIMTCVLGAVACIEEREDFRLGTGVVAGATTVVASIASIHATFNDFSDRVQWIHYSTTSTNADCGGKSVMLSGLWAMAVVSNMVMLAFVFMVFSSLNRNLIIIGSLELLFGTMTLSILVGNLFLAMHYKGLHKK